VPITGQRVVRPDAWPAARRLRLASGRSRREVADAKLGISEPTLPDRDRQGAGDGGERAGPCWLYGVTEHHRRAR
jgi:hypothetical protein